jgi:hypothetical protein
MSRMPRNYVNLTINHGHEIGYIEIVPGSKGKATASLVTDNCGRYTIARYRRQVDGRWINTDTDRSMRQGWRIDDAVDIFYADKSLVKLAINDCNYDEDVKDRLISYIENEGK